MGRLVDGVWKTRDIRTNRDGRFIRGDSQFRNWVTPDGRAGPTGEVGFEAEPGRYHLYVSLACPWAHRTLIVRSLKDLEEAIGVTVVSPLMLENGWEFDADHPDDLNGAAKLYEIYVKAKPDYSGKVSVPVLWDKKRKTIVNNESAEIIRMLNSAFDAFTESELNFYPEPLMEEIDAINATVYDNVNNGVYRAGFARSQDAYEEAVRALFETLEDLEARLDDQRFLVGSRLTEADWRLFTTLIRFDAVYFGHFKCNLKRIVDYPNLSGYLRDLYQVPGVKETVSFDHIKRHYYVSHTSINPSQIVPLGPIQIFDSPHRRDRLPAEGMPD